MVDRFLFCISSTVDFVQLQTDWTQIYIHYTVWFLFSFSNLEGFFLFPILKRLFEMIMKRCY